MINFDYLYDKSYYEKELYVNHYKEEKLYWNVISNAIILPHEESCDGVCGGIIDDKHEFIDGSGLHRGMEQCYDISGKKISESDEDIIFLGVWANFVWGHCLTDNIKRLWVLKNENFMKKYGHLRFVFVPSHNVNIQTNFHQLLKILGIDNIRLEPINEITKFRKIILPDECFWKEEDGTRFFTKEYINLIDQIRNYGKDHFEPTTDKKIYFTYRNFPAYRTIGEQKIEKFFSEIGFKIISPEEYTFVEQLNILLNCEEFASTIGSLAHNSIFLRDKTKMYLIPRANFITEYQLALDQVHDLDITYIDSTLSFYVNPKRKWEGPFYFIVSRNLEKCFGHKYKYKENKLDFYIYKHLGYSMNNVSQLPDYYKKVYKEYLTINPVWDAKETWLTKLFYKPKIRKLISRLFG